LRANRRRDYDERDREGRSENSDRTRIHVYLSLPDDPAWAARVGSNHLDYSRFSIFSVVPHAINF
jgi:hypothetical protein